jgi:hypothetical protein
VCVFEASLAQRAEQQIGSRLGLSSSRHAAADRIGQTPKEVISAAVRDGHPDDAADAFIRCHGRLRRRRAGDQVERDRHRDEHRMNLEFHGAPVTPT